MARFLRVALLGISILIAGLAFAEDDILTPDVSTAFQFLGLTPADFISDRAWVDDDTFLLPVVKEALTSPLAAQRISRRLADAAPWKVADAGQTRRIADFLNVNCPEAVYQDIDAQLAAARPTFSDPMEPLLSAFALAEGYRSQAFAKLTAADRETILLAAPLWFADDDDALDDTLKGSLYRAFGVKADTTRAVDDDSVLTVLAKINRDALEAATYALARGLSLAAAAWQNTKPPFMTASTTGVDGLVLAVRETPLGTFVVGGSGPNTYSRDFACIIDLGGDDRYLGRAGSAVAGLNHGVSAVLDMGGDDLYLGNHSANLGCGIMGLGAIVDMGGNDSYFGGAFSEAAAFCGAGLLFDGGGDDVFRASIFSQAASVCGIGLLGDASGRDLYDCGGFGQGFASTFGAGILVDGAGNDVYRAGGLKSHAPLRPEDFQSLSQGFAIGSRPRGGGGVALLRDLGGNDFYNGEIYAQGVGYWYSLGCLIDEGGNDVYGASQYSQGAGIHLAAGVLEDFSGDDRYGSRLGPAQGSAHDLSVGLLFDHSGDDEYTASGGQANSLTNSGSLFYDARGNDLYSTYEPNYGQGGVRPDRGFGNLAVFVDGEGRDRYGDATEGDSSLWLQGVFGLGYDVPRDSLMPREADPQVTIGPGDTMRTIADIFKDASMWEVTDIREKVRRARKALVAKGMEAVRWVAAQKLNTKDALERRAIGELFKAYPDSGASYLISALDSASVDTRVNALAILAEMKYRKAAGAVAAKLTAASYEKQRPRILSTLGDLGDTQFTEAVAGYTQSPKERERLAATISLGKLGDASGFDVLLDRLSDSLLTVRGAAIMGIGACGANVVSSLVSFNSRESQPLEALLLATAQLGRRWAGNDSTKKDVIRLVPIVRKYLEHPESRVRGAALVAAATVLDGKSFDKLASKSDKEADPLLRARWRQAKRIRNQG